MAHPPRQEARHRYREEPSEETCRLFDDLRRELVIAGLEREQAQIEAEDLREQATLYVQACATLEARLEAMSDHLCRTERALAEMRRLRDEDRTFRRSLERQLLASRVEAETAEEEFRVALEELDQSSRELAESNTRLRDLNETLERQVDQRTADLKAALADRDALIHEIHHQTRNNLQVISSLLNLQASRLEEPSAREVRKSFGRIQTMSLVHGLVFDDSSTADLPIGPLLATVCDRMTADLGPFPGIAVRVTGGTGLVPLKAAGQLALIVSELVANALTHAYPPGAGEADRTGTVEIAVSGEPRAKAIRVRDNGVGLDEGGAASRRGLGLLLVHTLARQVGARLRFASAAGSGSPLRPLRGTEVEIQLPQTD
ncbi:ATP-binding protein [Skermanella mucosa]|uniref:sensor histidine kinase n=1 Tax=Skermanella mucosa TaxID=1789672 RepID=UPI00192B499D|nr:sensor histidine kinase [Skermanella mucosa]UEM20035.1 ATP-binding protein [Skermanella mucosa]